MTSLHNHNLSLQEKTDLIEDIEQDFSYRKLGIIRDSASFRLRLLSNTQQRELHVYRQVTVKVH